jgi:hypothetical protein
VKSKENRNKLNEVVGMQMSVEELFVQTEREYEFDSGFSKGMIEGKKEVQEQFILNMMNDSIDDETILKWTNCSEERLQEIKRKFLADK